MHPIKFLSGACFASFVLLMLPVSICRAVEEESKPATPSDAFSITVNFPGGPLSKLMTSLDGKDGQPALSIIQSTGLDPVLPAFAVRNVRIDTVFAALGRIIEPQGYSLNPVGPNLGVLTRVEKSKGSAFASLQIESKLGDQSIEEFTGAIQAACEFANPDRKPSTLRFKYHPGTKLLFVAGTSEEIDIAYRIFGSLPDSPAKKQAPTTEKK